MQRTRSRIKSGSSPHRAFAAAGEESRRLRGIALCGRVAGWRVPRAALKNVVRDYLRALGLGGASVTVLLCGEAASRRLNRKHRGLDQPTDVLSFPAESGRVPRGFDGYLGDLALCLPYAWRKRGRFSRNFAGEAAFLLLHGLLHLSGRHHDTPSQAAALWRLTRRLHPLARPRFIALAALRPTRLHP